MKPRPRNLLILLVMAGLAAAGCRRAPPDPAGEKELPPAYPRNQINDPALHEIAQHIQNWALRQTGTNGKALYSRAEVPPPLPTVQPYGVGVYQQEPRLPVILTTGDGWKGLETADKEAKVREAFEEISMQLRSLPRATPLRPTLTIQTPQGMELAWINHLDPSGKNLHGDD